MILHSSHKLILIKMCIIIHYGMFQLVSYVMLTFLVRFGEFFPLLICCSEFLHMDGLDIDFKSLLMSANSPIDLTTPEPTAPQPAAPQPTGPQPAASQPTASQSTAPQPTASGSIASNATTATLGNFQTRLDLCLVYCKGRYYVRDNLQQSGENLINNRQTAPGVQAFGLSRIRNRGNLAYGYQLPIAGSTRMEKQTINGVSCRGL